MIINYFTKEELLEKVLQAKLYDCGRGLYPVEYNHALSTISGMWQQPDELVDLLMFLQNKNIKTFLNIGTYNGITFNLISDILNHFMDVKCITIDPHDWNPTKNKKYFYQGGTSDNFKNQLFDLVFIDGDHAYDATKKDYLNVGQYAKYCIFHDINDDYIKGNPELNGGCPRFWKEIKITKNHIEYDCSKKPVKVMGIGVLINDNI